MNPPDPHALRASRIKLVLIMLVFAAPIVAAMLFTVSGWQPSGKGNGLPISPQRNFATEQLQVRLADGSAYPWRADTPRLTLLALAGPGCARQCLETLTKMAAARVTLNNNVQRLRLLFLGTPPADADSNGMKNYWQFGTDVAGKLAAYVPATADSVTGLLVESDGTALALYPAGFDPSGLRKDLQKVIK